MLRRMAWTKWPQPMPKPSPWPAVTSTVSSWLASFRPLATGSERPCSVCMAQVLMKPGKLDEQPMPLTVATWWLGICNSTSAFCTAASTPKSPQPGHQSGSTLPLRSAITIGLGAVILIVAIVDFSLNHHFVGWHGKGSRSGKLFAHRRNDVMRHEGLSVVLANMAVGHEARLAAQIAGEQIGRAH